MPGEIQILHVLGSNRVAGTERHVLSLAAELRSMNCDAVIACPASATLVMSEAAARNIPTQTWFAALRRHPEIVHVHDGRSAILGWFLARRAGVKLVRTQHFVRPASATREGWSGSASRALHRHLNSRINGYIAVSDAARRAAVERRETGVAAVAAVAVIPPGVQLPSPAVVAAARAARREASYPVVAAAGRLEPERGFDILLRAIPLVQEARPDCRFVIAGSGSGETALRHLAQSLGVADVVTWTGWLSSIDEVLVQSHVYVNSSAWEGFGMAAAEAMAFGLPVIAAEAGANPELVDDGITGRLVTPGDPEALAGAVLELIQDQTAAAVMGERAAQSIQKYSTHTTAKTTLKFYRELESSSRRS